MLGCLWRVASWQLDTEASNQESQSRKKTPQNQQKKKNNEKKSKKKKSNPPNNSDSGSIIDLRQDSKAENNNICDGQKEAEKKYNSPLDFFGKPFYPEKATVSTNSTFLIQIMLL